MDWQNIAKAKRDAVNKAVAAQFASGLNIPDAETNRDGLIAIRELLSPTALKITEVGIQGGASALLAPLSAGELQAVEVVGSFIERAALAHTLTNCLSEVNFDAALARAKYLDEYHERTGKPLGALHGLPISVKDQFRVQGTETSMGYVGWLGRKESADDEGLLVRELTALGAVIICKTNVPTATLCMETDNNIMGFTVGARNRLLSAGGSSGGEATCIALGGSMLGFGTDVGGSVRFPSTANGTCALRPSHGRLSYSGLANCMIGAEALISVVGPIGRCLEDLELVTRILIEREQWQHDPKILPIPWRYEEADRVHQLAARKQLVFGVFRDDGVGRLSPPVARVLEEVVSDVRAAGFKAALSGEPLIPQLEAFFGAEPSKPVNTVQELWGLTDRRDKLRAAYHAYWNSTATETGTGRPVDFVLLPVMPTASYERTKAMHAGYCSIVNILDYTSVAINAGKVLATDHKVQRDSYYGDIDQAMWEQYNPQLFENTPIGIQVMGRRLEEERVLAAAMEVQRCIAQNHLT